MTLLILVLCGGVALAVLAVFVLLVVAALGDQEILADLDDGPYDWAEDGL